MYRLVAGPEFDLDFRRIDRAASRNPLGPEAVLRRQVLRMMLDLANGKTDGHHALGFEPGKGDLRDCVTTYVQSDPQSRADHRLVFREMSPAAPGEFARRELLAVKPREGRNNIYAHVCARLERHLYDRQPGLDRFGDRGAGSGGSQVERQAELDVKRAIAHAWDGQQPLSSSRPIGVGGRTDGSRGEAPGPRPVGARGGATGWPGWRRSGGRGLGLGEGGSGVGGPGGR